MSFSVVKKVNDAPTKWKTMIKRFNTKGFSSFYLLLQTGTAPGLCVPNSHIALNAIQRRYATVPTGDTIPSSTVSAGDLIPASTVSTGDTIPLSSLALLTLELESVGKRGKSEKVDALLLTKHFRKRFINQVMTRGQKEKFEYHGDNYFFTVNQALVEGQEKSENIPTGMLSTKTDIVFNASDSSGVKIVINHERADGNMFRHKEFNLQSLGIGGLSAEFADIFRRAFGSRLFPPHVINKLGIKHVKGMLLYGPPGTGKTLMARQIGKMLNGKEPKIVNGPELQSKWIGVAEMRVRKLFVDAENDQRTLGDKSGLHVIIFDEIDSICKARDGEDRHYTAGIVNQLLTKIDGVEPLNNILLIGITNRKDLLDEALLRPGRLEIQVEISLPDENGRLQILQVHTNKLKKNSFLAPDVNLQDLASWTNNYSGAELEGVVKSAVSFALNRQLSPADLTKQVDEKCIKVAMDDFQNALHDIIPAAFEASTDNLERWRPNGIVDCGGRHEQIYKKIMQLAEQVKVSKGSSLVTCLLKGPSGSGKTAMAANVGINSGFPCVKIIAAESMIGLSESSKCVQIIKVFEDAYKSPFSIVILDEIERLLEYFKSDCFSKLIAQTLLILLKQLPPKGKKIMVIGTTSKAPSLNCIGICDAFSAKHDVPTLKKEDAKKVLEQLKVFSEGDIDAAAEALNDVPIKTLYRLIEMAAQGEIGGCEEAIYSGKEKINFWHFYHCLQDTVQV